LGFYQTIASQGGLLSTLASLFKTIMNIQNINHATQTHNQLKNSEFMCMIPRIFNEVACQKQAIVMRKHTARMGIFHALSICALLTISTSPALSKNYSPTQIETTLLAGNSQVESSQIKPNSALDKLNTQAQEPLTMSAQYNQTNTMLSRLIALPDLYKNAQLSNPIDINKQQAKIAQHYDEIKQPYRLSMPYRSPPEACSNNIHSIAKMRLTLVNPKLSEQVELWQLELHEAIEHDAPLPAHVIKFLQQLP